MSENVILYLTLINIKCGHIADAIKKIKTPNHCF